MVRERLNPRILNICTSSATAVIFIVRSFMLVQINGGTDFWRSGWVLADVWTFTEKSLVAVYGQGEACSLTPTNIILKIEHALLQTW